MLKKRLLPFLALLLLAGLVTGIVLLFSPKPTVQQVSDYTMTRSLVVNQPSYYSVKQTLDPKLYRPIAPWVGRLILPKPEEFQQKTWPDKDWAWLEVYQAPPERQDLVGQKIRLGWQRSSRLDRYLQLVTTDIRFTPAAQKSEQQGNVVPVRLNGRSQVGPLQALAGARPEDDVLVSFQKAQVAGNRLEQPTLRVEQMPLMVTGRYEGLVKILGEVPAQSKTDIPAQCPGSLPCPSELVRVKHYNPQSRQFDGVEEVIRIPQQPLVSGDRFFSTPRQLADSTEGKAGWYIYGAKGKDGLFTVQALRPRSLFQLQPTDSVLGFESGSDYIAEGNWKNTPERKGTAQRVLVDPHRDSPAVALAAWKEGDRGLGIHQFGGIGGQKGEAVIGGTVTGHFAYYFFQVIRDPFTQELQWDISYYQVYAHNPQAILSGSQNWANYMGNLQRGWLNSRPTSNVMLKIDALQNYNFGGITLSPLTELQRQLEVMMARYRTGDGTGNSSVTPAASCVQDSNQAIYITIETLKEQIKQNPKIADWLNDHPNDPQNQRFQKLVQLGDHLYQILTPRGVIRPDWHQNAVTLAGVKFSQHYPFVQQDTVTDALLSWQSMLPRAAHDTISTIFLEQGATLWFLRTNQVGGSLPEILPLAPTKLFGEVPILSLSLRRIFASMVLLPDGWNWGMTVLLLLGYGAIAVPIGLKSGFLQWRPSQAKPLQIGKTLVFLFICPALIEELVFRVILLPYPDELNAPIAAIGWAILSLALFVLYHPLNALTFYKEGNPTLLSPIFLTLSALLGLTCTLAYWLTGSLWVIAFMHWVVVSIWLLYLNGLKLLRKELPD
ncbi:MAG: CPBP family glutamic-type intramembrane protease [Gloeobacterales cyanobacterium]